MAKKDKKVIKVKTATVGKSFGIKKEDSDIDFLKAKLLKSKKGETISDIGADILKRNKAKEPVEDDGLSDMARMILANKNKKEIIEVEEVVEEIEEVVLIEPEDETEPKDVINVDIIEPDVLDDIELELDIIDEEVEDEVEEIEDNIQEEIIIDGDIVDVSEYQKNEVEEIPELEIYNYKDAYSYVRIFKKLNNNTSFRLHIPKSTPRQQFYIDSTSSEFVIKHKNNILFDFYSYSGHIDFTIQGMLFQGKLYPFQELEFVKM